MLSTCVDFQTHTRHTFEFANITEIFFLFTELSDDEDKFDITGTVAELVVIELEGKVELKIAFVTDVVDVEQVVVTGEVKNEVATTPGDEEAKLVVTTEAVGIYIYIYKGPFCVSYKMFNITNIFYLP